LLHAALQEFEQLDKEMVKAHYAVDLLREQHSLQEGEDASEFFETYFGPELMRFKAFLTDVVQAEEMLILFGSC
jgi:hypothetical protein